MTVAQQFDYWLLADRNLDQYISLTQAAAKAYEQARPAMQQIARDWAQISAVAQKQVEQIARFRAQREKRNNRTITILTDLAGAQCPLGDCSGALTRRDADEDERFAEIVGRGN